MVRSIVILIVASLLMVTPLQAQEDQAEEAVGQEEPTEERRGVRRLGDVVGEGTDEWSMDIPSIDLPPEPVEEQPQVSLPDEAQDEQLQALLTRRAFVPEDPDIQTALDALMDEVEIDALEALDAGDSDLALQLVGVIEQIDAERPVIEEVRAEITRRASVAETLSSANAALAAGRLVDPPGQSAVALYRQVLDLEPGNAAAVTGLANTQAALIEDAVALAEEFDFEGAEALLTRAAGIRDAEDSIAEARTSINDYRQRQLEEMDQNAVAAIDEGRFDDAEEWLTQLIAMGYERERIEQLRGALNDAVIYGSFEPGGTFTDNLERLEREGPTMVVIPAGSFMMGSPDNEDDRFSNEGPLHRVTIDRGFALSRTEITVGEFALFVDDTGYRTDAEIEGSSRVYDPQSGRMDSENRITWRNDYVGEEASADLPVVHVSWNDARAYANWLSEQTGRDYRLPSEAEFEYALRAGTQTPYWWGEGPPEVDNVENVTGEGDQSRTNARWTVAFRRYADGFWGPAPAGRLAANPFGLHDMGGNVMEWTEDCWHDSFVRAPADGSAWVNPGCGRRVIKGGSWTSTPVMSRSAFRLSSTQDTTDMRVGFRVARDL
jgi:formylglycine-generating enzyme required for sulfatase activity